MTEKERFMTDDAGTLIDMETRDTFDIVEEVVDILNNYENTVFHKDERIKELEKENEQLRWSKKILRANKKDCELGMKYEREQWLKMDNMRIEHIRFLQKRLKKNGLSIYMNDGDVE